MEGGGGEKEGGRKEGGEGERERGRNVGDCTELCGCSEIRSDV